MLKNKGTMTDMTTLSQMKPSNVKQQMGILSSL